MRSERVEEGVGDRMLIIGHRTLSMYRQNYNVLLISALGRWRSASTIKRRRLHSKYGDFAPLSFNLVM